MESTIERQAIRAAVALAAASSHGQSPEVIADLRDEAAQLIGLCVHPSSTSDELRLWCDDAYALVTRLISTGSIREEHILPASAAVLRLRLAAARAAVGVAEKKSRVAPVAKHAAPEEPKPVPVDLNANLKKIVAHLKEHPGVRTMELVAAFTGSYSARSIKRYLSELLELKVVQRRELEDGGVAYFLRG